MAAVEPATLSTPKPTLFWMVGVALAVATLIVVCFVLPAEFRIDPLGIGKATGVIRLAGPRKMSATEAALAAAGIDGADSEAGAPASNNATAGSPGAGATSNTHGLSARYYDGGYRSDFVDIPLSVAGAAERGEELEYKVRMKNGDTLAYSWSAAGITNPEEFYYDFHGEAPAKEQGAEGTVVEYRQATGTQSHGTLVAPFDGVFGWYLQNQSEKPVVVHLKISGFYTLVPSGEYGNEAGIEANQPAKR
jgi:hypothetical protein